MALLIYDAHVEQSIRIANSGRFINTAQSSVAMTRLQKILVYSASMLVAIIMMYVISGGFNMNPEASQSFVDQVHVILDTQVNSNSK